MSCSCNKISSFDQKACSLQADISYAMYKEIQFGNNTKALEYEKQLNNIASLSLLVEKSKGCKPATCSGSATTISIDNEVVQEVLDPSVGIIWPETFKGALYNPDRGKVVSLVTFGDGITDAHTGIRLYEWDAGVPTMIFEQDGLIEIAAGSYTSFYYSKKRNAYYIRSRDVAPSPVTVPSKVIKVLNDFSSVIQADIPYTLGNPDDMVMEIVDERDVLLVKLDPNTIGLYSLNDLSPQGTVDTTGQPYQKMTLSPCNCKVFLTGNGTVGNAQIAVVDLVALTTTNLLDDSSLYNNTSVIDNDGNLLVLTSASSFPFTMQLQKWDVCCDTPNLLDTIDLGVNFGPALPDMYNLLTLAQDGDGNIFVGYVKELGFTSLAVFNANYELSYIKELSPLGVNFGPFSESVIPSWTNNQFVDSSGYFYVHSHSKNSLGGTANYFLDYSSASNDVIKCVELTDQEICDLTNKLNGIPKPKQYKPVSTLVVSDPTGLGGSCDRQFVYQQTTPALVWTINHNTGCFPVIVTLDDLGNRIFGSEVYIDKNTVEITFSSPQSGTAYLTY